MAAISDRARRSPESASPASPASSDGQIPLEQPPKLKGRRRLLQNLQRMSSTPSLIRRGRSHSTGYRRDNKASLSCVSLSQSSYNPCLGNGSSSQLYGGLNARPITPGVPCNSTDDQDGGPRIRLVGNDSPNHNSVYSRTVRLPSELRPVSHGSPQSNDIAEEASDTEPAPPKVRPQSRSPQRKSVDFWNDMPDELKMRIFRYLTPQELVCCSSVSKAWNKMCFDGQLWTTIDTADYYHMISSDSLVKLITAAGPFVRNLNLRGCVQLRDKWLTDGERMADLCRNIVNFSAEGSRIDKNSTHQFVSQNARLEYINFSGLASVSDSAMKIISQSCPQLQALNVSWCINVTTKGLKKIVASCQHLRDLRASEIHGFNDEDFAYELFEQNNLERLIMSRTDLTDMALKIIMQGVDPEIDILTGRPLVSPRQLRHLDIHQCPAVTDNGLKSLAHHAPDLEGLQISQCPELTDESVIEVIHSTPKLSHLELEDLVQLTNNTLVELAMSACAPRLQHLNISFCEALGDIGMLQVMKSCISLRSVEMDNTRISDLTLMEASCRVRKRGYDETLPRVGLHLVVFDCSNITWAGVKEVLSSNAYIPRSRKPSPSPNASTTPSSTTLHKPPPPVYPNETIYLKCFYGWQMTVDEHQKRVLRGDLAAASRLDRKWADYMNATNETGVIGIGQWVRRRHARDVQRLYNTEEDEDAYGIGGISAFGGRRRRAQSGGTCSVM